MAEQAGFRIGDEFYPFPDNYTLGDSVLIETLTGLDMEEFAEKLAESEGSARIFAGLIGVAVWRQNPRWSSAKAARFVESLDLTTISSEAPEEEPDEDPPSPPPAEDDDGGTLSDGSIEPVSESIALPVSGLA